MAHLQQYEDFIQRVEGLGFMALSRSAQGLPGLGEETQPGQWHTGDAQSDPWLWKDRAAQEKRAAYGCLLGGQKGFVAGWLYPAFYAACHPRITMPERWAAGVVNQTAWQLWQLFEEHALLNTSEVRRLMGVSRSSGAGPVDAGIQQLEREYYITGAGVRQRVAQTGKPFGWPATLYDRVARWAPAEWLSEAARMTPGEARRQVLDAAGAMGGAVDLAGLAKLLWGRLEEGS